MAQFGGVGGKIIAVTTNVAFNRCYGLLVGTGGTATITDATEAVLVDVPLQAGYNPISCTKVVFGTAANIWALYEVP